MQAVFLDIRENSDPTTTTRSQTRLCEKIFCLCHRLSLRLEISPSTRFNALLLAIKYLGPAGSSMITPNSKNSVQEPLSLVSAASVLAALASSEKRENSEKAVLEAASSLFDSSFAEKVTLEQLKKSAEEILDTNKSSEKPADSPTTAQLVEDLHTALPKEISFKIEIKVAYLLLELLCLANNGSQCAAVLQRGGTLVAGACLVAACCLASPPLSAFAAQMQGPEMLPAIASLTGFPGEVILAQSQSIVREALSLA
jgi:hypothetical protein